MDSRANSASARDIAYHVHGYTNLKKHEEVGPHIIESGSGVRVTDDNGKPLAGVTVNIAGTNKTNLILKVWPGFGALLWGSVKSA